MESYVVERTLQLRSAVEALEFPASLYVYDPLVYAWDLHRAYLENYVRRDAPLLLLGMNPGPFGMAQDGVPFGEVHFVKDFLHLDGAVGRPTREHPKRPVQGLSCTRSEPSGKRLWSFLADRFGTARRYADSCAILNYCPLVFMDAGPTGRNVTPDKLPKDLRVRLERLCDGYLADLVAWSHARLLVGIGAYATKKLEAVASGRPVDTLLHPSPASPLANRGWAQAAKAKFDAWEREGFFTRS